MVRDYLILKTRLNRMRGQKGMKKIKWVKVILGVVALIRAC